MNKKEFEENKKPLANELHDKYEQFAEEEGWKTQGVCKVHFDNLPEANKYVRRQYRQGWSL